MEWSNVAIAFGLTIFAGLATGIGGAIAFFAKRTNTSFLSFSLGFSAGVMIFISFTELLNDSHEIISHSYTDEIAAWLTFGFFIGGFLIAALIDKIIPARENPHELRSIEQMDIDCPKRGRKLLRLGAFTAIALAIHNFPEGIAVSVPVYYATGSRKKAFFWAALSGLSEPLGAAFGYFILSFFNNPVVLGYVFSIVAGIMIYISFDELLPAAHKYGKHHVAIYGLFSGIILIGISLLLL